MRPSLLLLGTWLIISVGACGRIAKQHTDHHTPATGTHYIRDDDDNDDDRYDHADDNNIRKYGHSADSTSVRAVQSLVRRYYTAVATSDGVTACVLLDNSLGRRSIFLESALRYPPPPSSPAFGKLGCPQIMSLLFKQANIQRATAQTIPFVARLRVHGTHGLALLGFTTSRERYMPVEYQLGTWKIGSLFDDEIP